MAVLTSPGVGSGLDVQSIVSQLVAVEALPLQRMDRQKATLDAELSGYGRLKAAFENFRTAMQALDDASKFKVFSASTSDDEVLGATASSTAAKGTYQVQVVRIAENHRMAAGTVYANTDTDTVGAEGDTMTITVGGSAFTVDIGAKNLGEVRDAINAAADNPGVTASILKDDNGYHLTLSANETGSSNFMSLSYSGVDPFAMATLNADRDASSTVTAADLDAVLTIESQFNVTSSSNAVSSAIEGVTLNLAAPGTATVTVDRDKSAVRGSIKTFVDAYNALSATMTDLRAKELATDRASLTAMEAQVRSVLNTEAQTGGSFSLLFQIGITSTKAGTLQIDDKTLTGALDSDFDSISRLFSAEETGFAVRFGALADDLLDAEGVVALRQESFNAQLKQLASRREAFGKRLEIVQDRYLKQFTALDTMILQLNATSSFLTQQLAALSAASSSSSR
ncbi:MAG: flagellar filament capping protein FliD [Gammaproteobacteria bacterium]